MPALQIYLMIILIMGTFLQAVGAQASLRGKLQHADSGAPVAFAHIGVIGAPGIGTISDENGDFELHTRQALAPEQVIQFSAIGFETVRIKVAQVQKHPLVKIKPQTMALPEITVTDRRRVQVKTRGHYGRSRKVVTGWSAAISRGGIRAARIKLPNRSPDALLQQLRFHLAYNEYDSILFRLHFFYPDASGKLPGEQISLPEDLYLHHDGTTGDITFDLKPWNILVDRDLFAGIEVVRTYGKCETSECLHFSVVLLKDRIYYRNTVTDTWESNKLGSPAIEVVLKY